MSENLEDKVETENESGDVPLTFGSSDEPFG